MGCVTASSEALVFMVAWLSLTTEQVDFAGAFGTTGQLYPPSFRQSRADWHTSARIECAVHETSMGDLNVAQDEQEEAHFDPLVWQKYELTARAVVDMGSPRNKGRKDVVLKKDNPEDWSRAIEYLLDKRMYLPVPALAGSDFRTVASVQRENFLAAANMTMAQHGLAMRVLTYMGDKCAKEGTPEALQVAWYKLREAGMTPRENCISTYMYAMSLSDSPASGEVAAFHDLLFQPNEKTITLRIKSMIAEQDAAGAKKLLASFPNTDGDLKKLRTFLPVLKLYCSKGDVKSALRLYREMRELPGVHFDPDTHALLIGALAENGCLRSDSHPIEGAHQLGFSNTNGPGLFDELVSEMAAEFLELNEASARSIYYELRKGFAEGPREEAEREQEIAVDNSPAKENKLVASRVSFNENTAICPKTNVSLQLFRLNADQERHVHDTLLDMAGIQYDKFTEVLEARFKQKIQKSDRDDYAVQELSRFSDWLNERDGESFTAIVDGPNVAYFGHGDVHYSQVKLVVDELEGMNERPLVIMPQKYTAPKFNVKFNVIQELSDKDEAVLNELRDSGRMYIVPSKCLDDYYWMLASVSNQTLARDHGYMHVSTSDGDGRFPGMRPMLITNDQMRDHRWELLEPRLFRRWFSCHVVNFKFTEYASDEWEERDVELQAADFFSHEIQGNPSEGSGGLVWHFPVRGWEENEWLCVSLPR